MISRLGLAISAVARRVFPDPLVLAVGLTLLVVALALVVPGPDGQRHTIADICTFWNHGVWNFLAFAMQMSLILVTGYALAASPVATWAIRRVADLPRSMTSAALLVAGVAMVAGVLNWGLGLIIGAMLARDVARRLRARNIPHHYPLLAGAGYLGLLVWHGGFSGSAPLKTTQPEDVAEIFGDMALPFDTIPLDQSLASPLNLVTTGGLILVSLVVVALLVPRNPRDMIPATAEQTGEDDAPDLRAYLKAPFGEAVLGTALGCFLLLATAYRIHEVGYDRLGLNEINLLALGLGLLAHPTPSTYAAAVADAARGCGGIIVQFPLYAGIMGLMQASGMTARIADQLVAWGDATTAPILTFGSAALVNLVVPSGGGQWGVQGPVVMEAAAAVDARPATILMAFSYGDQLTNMLQPFWALPLLAITGIRARDIVGYTTLIMVAAAIWIVAMLLLLG